MIRCYGVTAWPAPDIRGSLLRVATGDCIAHKVKKPLAAFTGAMCLTENAEIRLSPTYRAPPSKCHPPS